MPLNSGTKDLLRSIKSSNWKIRLKASKSLGSVYEIDSILFLLEALEDSDPRVRKAALKSLGLIAEARFSGKSSKKREAAKRSFESVGIDKIIGDIFSYNVLNSGEDERQATQEALASFRSAEDIQMKNKYFFQSKSKTIEALRKMTVEEACRKHGQKTFETHGREFYEEIGHKGGEKVSGEKAPEFYSEIGSKAQRRPMVPEAGPPLEGEVPEEEEITVGRVITESPSQPPAKRYADYIFKEQSTKQPLKNGLPLILNNWYILDVGIRTAPIGIPSKQENPMSIVEPNRNQDVEILVAIDSEDFDVKENVQKLILPPSGDSTTNAEFALRPLAKTTSIDDLKTLNVRLYYQFNLLEVSLIEAEVVGKPNEGASSKLGLEKPISFSQTRIEREIEDFQEVFPRSMHIDIDKKEDQYLFRFLFEMPNMNRIVFEAPVHLSSTELESSLLKVRTILTEMALGDFANIPTGNDDTVESVRKLARAGSNLWTVLFNDQPRSSIHNIGKLLKSCPIKSGTIIQISAGENATDFVFPWSLLYDHDLPSNLPEHKDELPDAEGFWGIRYMIEQRLPGMETSEDTSAKITDKLKIGFTLNSSFPNSTQQQQLFDNLVMQSAGKLFCPPPITDSNEFEAFLKNDDADILYFYCHGYSRPLKANLVFPSLIDFFQLLDKMDKNSPIFMSFKESYEEIRDKKFENDDSWMMPDYGKIYLLSLMNSFSDFEFASKPVVILNCCESGNIIPSLAESFVDFFIKRGAKSVIGTECPMTCIFAHPFGQSILESILKGETIGSAMLNARRYFYNNCKNPLGLAYTLFGSATTRFQPNVI